MSKTFYACSFIIASVLLAGLAIFLLKKFEPVQKSFSIRGRIVKISGNSIEICPSSGANRLMTNLENISTYQEILEEALRDNLSVRVYFSENYYPLSKKTVWLIEAVSLTSKRAAKKKEPTK